MNIPQHLAIIMDGNGRWAKQRGLPRTEGHKQGLKRAEEIVFAAKQRGVKFLSLYVFSTENWQRPKGEISLLFSLADKYIAKVENFCKQGVRVVVSGSRQGLPPKLVAKIEEIQQKTAHICDFCLNLCINYGGRQDIVQAAEAVVAKGQQLTEQTLAQNLQNSFLPNPDLVLRTGGQQRLSNFLLFQSAYAELCFSNVLWPDFDSKMLDEVLADYASRTRTFGALKG